MAERKQQITHTITRELTHPMAKPEGLPDGKIYVEIVPNRVFGQGAFIKTGDEKEWSVHDNRTDAEITKQVITGPGPAPELWRIFGDQYVIARRVAASDTKITYEDMHTGTTIATFPAEPAYLSDAAVPIAAAVVVGATLPIAAAYIGSAALPVTAAYLSSTWFPVTAGYLSSAAIPVTSAFAAGATLPAAAACINGATMMYHGGVNSSGGRIFTIGGKFHIVETLGRGKLHQIISHSSIIYDRKFQRLKEIPHFIMDATNERIWVLRDFAGVWCYFDVLDMRIIHTLSLPETFQEWSEKDIAIERRETAPMTRFRRFDIPAAAKRE
jgi:hypothetical protein